MLERFAALGLARASMLEIGRHIASCNNCRVRLRDRVQGGAEMLRRIRERWPAAESEDYDRVFRRVATRASARLGRIGEERRQAQHLLRDLDREPVERWKKIAAADGRLHNATLVALLLERCREVSKEDPARGEEIAHCALAISAGLAPDLQGLGLQNDLRARAWSLVGNARRLQYDLRGAEEAFEQAERFLAQGSMDPLEVAQLLDLKTSLLRAQRRLDEALLTIQEVARIYRKIGDRHLEGRALVSQAMIHGSRGEQEKGIDLFLKAVQRIDPGRDSHLIYLAYHNLVADLVEAGRLEEASRLFPEVQRSACDVASPIDGIRNLWLEALIDSGFGRNDEAATKLAAVRQRFIALGIGYDTAIVSLDLARAYLLQGRIQETKQLAAEIHALFSSREIHREAIAALIVFQRAAEQEAATVGMVEEISRYLKRNHGEAALRESERPS